MQKDRKTERQKYRKTEIQKDTNHRHKPQAQTTGTLSLKRILMKVHDCCEEEEEEEGCETSFINDDDDSGDEGSGTGTDA